MSGRSKPPSVHCGIQLCAIPGRTPSSLFALFWLAPAGVRRFTVSFPSTHQRVTRTRLPGASSPIDRLNRIIARGRPCRFCAIAVAPATRTCIRLRTRPVGGLSSAAFRPPSAALSLSRVVWMVKDDKGSDRGCHAGPQMQNQRCRTKDADHRSRTIDAVQQRRRTNDAGKTQHCRRKPKTQNHRMPLMTPGCHG